ncbi:MAG: COX15/CtaA family protein [Bacteroidota bacterium]|nr:COX15/CtaA family protein [Bacteroidota bacterium]
MVYHKGLHRYSVILAVCTFGLIFAGGLVTSTGSGLSVPDWPNTYGYFMFAFPIDKMVGGIVYEHTHRLIASVVGMLTVILAIWLGRKEERKWLRVLGYVAVGAVIAQGVLGGLTVLFLLPVSISVGHATLAQTFFAIVCSIALFTSKWWGESPKLKVQNSKSEGSEVYRRGVKLVWLSIGTTAVVYIQLILGALMRHTHSGLVVPDFPLAWGQLFPSLSPDAIANYNTQLINANLWLAADGQVTAGQIVIHMLHRLWAVVVAIMIVWTSVTILRNRSSIVPRVRSFAYYLLGLIILQVTLGAFTVLTRKAVDITTLHVAVGALILVTCVLLSLHTIRIYGWRRSPASVPVAEKVENPFGKAIA